MKYISILFLCYLFFSCDVPGVIKFKNKTNQPIEINLKVNEKYENSFLKTELTIDPFGVGTQSFNFGTRWNDSFVSRFPMKILDTIFLKVGDIQYICESDACKRKIFSEAKIRRMKRELRIKINSDLIEKAFVVQQ